MKRAALVCGLVFAGAMTMRAQEGFPSADAAVQAVIEAAGQHDVPRMTRIFGPKGTPILTSGDASQDRAEQTEFAQLAAKKHSLLPDARNKNRAILLIGDEDWPFPVPLVRTNGTWSFDASETKDEMQARRIGTNELDAIEICAGYVEAQQAFAERNRKADGATAYASHIVSSASARDGLYWEGGADPLVPRGFADAAWEGQKPAAKPYHGYYFRILDRQGAHATGGVHNYLLKNKLTGGFGLVAWPAQYGITGVHTYIVNQDGVIYEKDIVPQPGSTGSVVTSFDPDPSWQPVD